MIIKFEDKSYIEAYKDKKGNFIISIGALNTDKNSFTVNSAELTEEQFKNIIADLKITIEENNENDIEFKEIE